MSRLRAADRPLRLVVGVSGASGTSLALRFLSTAASLESIEALHVVVSPNALRVASHECDPPVSTAAALVARAVPDEQLRSRISIHNPQDIGAPIASGSYPVDGMVIIPCSSATLAAVASGISRGLMQRSADLMLKERRPLILALRETPFSLVHIENMRRATAAGAIVMPPIPSFYAGETWDNFLDHFVMRVLDFFGVDAARSDLRWKSEESER